MSRASAQVRRSGQAPTRAPSAGWYHGRVPPGPMTGDDPMNPLRLRLTALALSLALAVPATAWGWAPPGADTHPAPLPVAGPKEATATFAGGCFWCMETAFEGVPGIRTATSGYCGGTEKRPTYEQVGAGLTGHAESVQVIYDPKVISTAQVLELYWHDSDPFSAEGQFCDRGHQYRPAIFYHDEVQHR